MHWAINNRKQFRNEANMSCLVTKTPWVAESRGCLSSLSSCSGWLSPCPQWAPEAAAILCTRDSGRQKKRDCFLPCSSICQKKPFLGSPPARCLHLSLVRTRCALSSPLRWSWPASGSRDLPVVWG